MNINICKFLRLIKSSVYNRRHKWQEKFHQYHQREQVHLLKVHNNDHDIPVWSWKSPLSPLDIDFYFDTQFIIMINYLCMFQLTQSKETQGDKNRHVLRKLYNIDDSDFDRFLDHLKTTQPKVSERINMSKHKFMQAENHQKRHLKTTLETTLIQVWFWICHI